MKEIKVNSKTLKEISEIAKTQFPEKSFNFYWTYDVLCMEFNFPFTSHCYTAACVFSSLIKHFYKGLAVCLKFTDNKN